MYTVELHSSAAAGGKLVGHKVLHDSLGVSDNGQYSTSKWYQTLSHEHIEDGGF